MVDFGIVYGTAKYTTVRPAARLLSL